MCECFACTHIGASVACLMSMEAGGGLLGGMALLYQNEGASAACHTRATEESLGLSL